MLHLNTRGNLTDGPRDAHHSATTRAHGHACVHGKQKDATAGDAGQLKLLDRSDDVAEGAADGRGADGVAKVDTAPIAGELTRHGSLLLLLLLHIVQA